jgi:hypothetical protein
LSSINGIQDDGDQVGRDRHGDPPRRTRRDVAGKSSPSARSMRAAVVEWCGRPAR